MSFKNKERKQINEVKENENKKIKEPMTKLEKIFTTVLVSVGFIILTIIILVNIPWGGEKEKIARKFESLTIDNVFENITYDKLQDKINNGESFDVLLISTDQEEANYFIYCVDYVVKGYKENNLEIPDTIYIFNTRKIKDNQKEFFKETEGRRVFNQPTLIHYEDSNNNGVSVNESCSSRLKVEDYDNNYFNLIVEYFKLNYEY